MDIPLEDDFAKTLDLVRKARANVRSEPLTENNKGGIQANPHYILLKDQELHLRGLANLLGPKNVEPDIQREFKESREFVLELMEAVLDAPIADGQRHVQTRNPLAVIMTGAQTHVRGCARLLQTANAVVPVDGDNEFESLFDEPART